MMASVMTSAAMGALYHGGRRGVPPSQTALRRDPESSHPSAVRVRWKLGWVALCLVACAPPSPGPATPPTAQERTSGVAPTPDALPESPLRLLIDVEPKPNAAHFAVRVTSRLHGRDRIWTMKHGSSGMSDLQFEDPRGEIEHEATSVVQGGIRVTLRRAPEGPVSARYRVAGEPFSAARPLAPSLDPNQARFSGEAMYLLPETAEREPVSVQISVASAEFAPGARAASTLGLGSPVHTEATADALRRSTVLVGTLGTAEFEAPEGVDRAAWLGYSSFDPRQVVAEIAGFRTAARQHFDARTSSPSMTLLVSDARPAGEFDVMRRAASVLIHTGVSQTWDGPLRIAAMQQMMREWLGAQLSIAPADASFTLERAWFDDGVNRWLTRDLLFRFGLLTPEEYRDDIEQVMRVHVTHHLTKRPLHTLVREPPHEAGVLIVARGALYALVLDGAIRKKSRNERSLGTVLRALFPEARAAGAPLPPERFVRALEVELGPDAPRLDSGVLRGDTPAVVPTEALGRCFTAVPRRYERYALGFRPRSHEQGPMTVSDLDPKGPAARAGLVDGDEIATLKHTPDRLDRDVVIAVRRAGKEQRLTYRPSGGFVTGQGFERKPRVADESCR